MRPGMLEDVLRACSHRCTGAVMEVTQDTKSHHVFWVDAWGTAGDRRRKTKFDARAYAANAPMAAAEQIINTVGFMLQLVVGEEEKAVANP